MTNALLLLVSTRLVLAQAAPDEARASGTEPSSTARSADAAVDAARLSTLVHASAIQARTGRTVGAALLALSGAATIALGPVAKDKGSTDSAVFYSVGGVELLLAGLSLFQSPLEKFSDDLDAGRVRTLAEAEARLDSIARSERTSRFWAAGILTGLGALEIGLGIGRTTSADAPADRRDAVGLIAVGTLATAVGITSFFVRGPAEAGAEAYHTARAPALVLRPAFRPVPGGGVAVVAGAF